MATEKKTKTTKTTRIKKIKGSSSSKEAVAPIQGNNIEFKPVIPIQSNNAVPENVFTINPNDNNNNPEYSLTSYIFNGEEYNYLNEDKLRKDFDITLASNNLKESYRIRLLIFRINDQCKEPFLQFYVEAENYKLIFPEFNLPYSSFEGVDINTTFENICNSEFQKLTNISNDVATKTYRGFIEDNDNTIYVLFDSTYTDLLPSKRKSYWGLLDELINEKHIYDNIIDKDIFVMVHKNEHIAYIKDRNNNRITMPCCLYLCKKNPVNGNYENVHYTDEIASMSVMETKINHMTFGNHHFFTTEPISDENILNLKRYSVFIYNSLYILNIHKNIQDIDFRTDDIEDYEEYIKTKTQDDYSSIYFFEQGVQLWCIKTMSRFVEL